MKLTLDIAQTIATAAFAKGRDLNLKPLTVAVLDAGGHIKLILREDGASTMRPQIAIGKANGAISLGIGSRAIFERAKNEPFFVQAMNGLAGGSLVPVPGGVLVKDNDTIIGAVGITGDTSENDETCAIHGINAADLTPDAG